VADVLVPGLLLRERDALNALAKQRRISAAELVRRLIRQEIGSDGVTTRREGPTVTERLKKAWVLPGSPEHEELKRQRRASRATGAALTEEDGAQGVARAEDPASAAPSLGRGRNSPDAEDGEGD
jgi:hypothetical protein